MLSNGRLKAITGRDWPERSGRSGLAGRGLAGAVWPAGAGTGRA